MHQLTFASAEHQASAKQVHVMHCQSALVGVRQMTILRSCTEPDLSEDVGVIRMMSAMELGHLPVYE